MVSGWYWPIHPWALLKSLATKQETKTVVMTATFPWAQTRGWDITLVLGDKENLKFLPLITIHKLSLDSCLRQNLSTKWRYLIWVEIIKQEYQWMIEVSFDVARLIQSSNWKATVLTSNHGSSRHSPDVWWISSHVILRLMADDIQSLHS